MTPTQREAALRMIECGEPSNRLTPEELAAWADDADGLLRELVGSNSGLGAWGRDDLMAIAAVRYCLGRMTYITSDCSEWLVAQWPNIMPRARAVIQRDIDEAFARDDEAREAGDSYKPLGWDCDRAVWQKVRELWAPNVRAERPQTAAPQPE